MTFKVNWFTDKTLQKTLPQLQQMNGTAECIFGKFIAMARKLKPGSG